MKTTGFGTINITEENGECILTVYSPRDGTVTLTMLPDEVMIFLVEVGNGLADGRIGELRKLIEYNFQKELRR